MGTNPINLAIRFLLEMIAFVSIGIWSWNQANGFSQYLLAIGIPFLIAIIWGVFAVPNDPSRSGRTVVITSGIIRLVIEILIFTAATLALYNVGFNKFSYAFALIVNIHYIVSYDRVLWLLKN